MGKLWEQYRVGIVLGFPINSSGCEPYDRDVFHEEEPNHFLKT